LQRSPPWEKKKKERDKGKNMQWLRLSRHIPLDSGEEGTHLDRKVVLFYSPEMEELAQEILSLPCAKDLLVQGEIEWKSFEDGFPNLFINHIDSIRGRHAIFLASFLNQGSLLAQLAVLYALPKYLVKSLIVVCPYFPTGTMERVDSEGQIATAVTFARLLSNIPLTQRGPAKLIIYDIHALQNRFYFSDTAVPLLVSAVPLFIEKLESVHNNDEISIAFPDEGASKRFGKMFAGFEIVICTKIREGDKRIVTVKEGEIKNRHVFIVDDLVKTGGTLIECKNALYRLGATKVSAFVTHAVFPLDSWRRFTEPKEKEQAFHYFYTTNTCPETTKLIQDKKPFEVLSLAQSIADNVFKY